MIETEQGTILTAEDIKFTRLLAKGMTPTTAYRQAFPLQAKLSYDYIRKKALALSQKYEIRTEVETTRETQAKLARLAEDRIEQILTRDSSTTKGNKVAEVAMFMYDHANGKAQQSVNVTSTSVSFNIDLTGAEPEQTT